MSEELGRIERPEAEKFAIDRKLYMVPLIFMGDDAHDDYVRKVNLYWAQVREHVGNLEGKIGKVQRVYHELIATGGEDGLKMIEKLNPSSFEIAMEKCRNGAELEAVEDKELSGESIAWERCLFVGFVSEKVAQTVSESYLSVTRNRYEFIANKINDTLKPGEASLLFIRERHWVQFPHGIQVFSVFPPVLDEIHRWLRDRSSAVKSDS